jgi:hypothetical protein
MNNTNPPHVQFFKKPVYTTMALLSLLGNQELQAVVRMPDDRYRPTVFDCAHKVKFKIYLNITLNYYKH